MLQRAAVIASLALLGGVLSAPTGATQQPPPSPCGLLQPSEIKASLHAKTVSTGDLTIAPDGSESLCEWIVMTDPNHGYGFTLHARPGFTDLTFKQQRQSALGTKRTIVKLGDDAYSERSTRSAPLPSVDVWVLHGSVVIGLEAAHNVGTKPLVALGHLVLARL